MWQKFCDTVRDLLSSSASTMSRPFCRSPHTHTPSVLQVHFYLLVGNATQRAHSFRQVSDLSLRLINQSAQGAPLASFDIETATATSQTAIHLGSLRRRREGWAFFAAGDGSILSLKQLWHTFTHRLPPPPVQCPTQELQVCGLGPRLLVCTPVDTT